MDGTTKWFLKIQIIFGSIRHEYSIELQGSFTYDVQYRRIASSAM